MLFKLSSDSIPQQAGQRKTWTNLQGASKALAIADLMAQHAKPLLVICESSQQAFELEAQLRFFNPQLNILHFPDWEILPYDKFSPHHDIVSARLRCLYQLQNKQNFVLFIPINTLMQRLSPVDFVAAHTLQVQVGDELNLNQLRQMLEKANYHCVANVYEHGEFAVRGGIIDIFPMGSELPYRIELFDVEVEQIKTFDPETQLSLDKAKGIDILPAHEFLLDAQSLQLFEDNWYKVLPQLSLKDCYFYQDLKKHIAFPGIEFYLPLFFENTASLLDYLPENTLLLSDENCERRAQAHWQEINHRYEQYRGDIRHPLLPPQQVFLTEEQLFTQLKLFPRIIFQQQAVDQVNRGYIDFNTQTPSDLAIQAHAREPYAAIKAHLEQQNSPVLFCADSLGRREALLAIFKQLELEVVELDSWQAFLELKPALAVTVSYQTQGLKIDKLEMVSESQLFGQRVQQHRRRKQHQQDPDTLIKSLTELKIGDAVVHIDHGIGRYQGLQLIELGQQEQEFLQLQYADEALLYVPVTSLHLISRYSGSDSSNAPLHRLGNEQWQKAKAKAKEQIHDVAAELLDIYAQRAAKKGYSYQTFSDAYQQFSANFPFEETADQLHAINQVLEDMASSRPMDRLVCGDVGFGKTEVAMRAAFTAAFNGKQVAVLVPTTLLAQQHYESFVDRFAGTPMQIRALSRFQSAKEQKETIAALAEGKVDIVIGTHKLIQKDIQFKDLGLVIIDEEHRFGVKQKDNLKALRAEVDILALTATPIPRTLNMSMSGLRDLSVIATPPARRLSIKTFVRQKEDGLIKEAILRELLRGGQVYYLHNEVSTIENVKEDLQALLPEARIGIGHGQMRERELERVMTDFYHKRYNILLCTTIIETGIDIPSANTIIIERADKFGLAQLHQLRGRVGRSHQQAYAYLLTPPHKKVSKDAEKRLLAITEASDLGAGFMLATHDLEIRGAGELLGDEQSGQIQTLGFSLYMDLLDRAVKAIQRGENIQLATDSEKSCEINLNIPAIIPEDYIADVQTRLTLYKQIANCEDLAQLDEAKVHLIDRFGLLPEPTKNLFAITALKIQIADVGIERIELGSAGGKITFSQQPNIDPMRLVQLVQSAPAVYQLEGANVLRFKQASETNEERIALIKQLLTSLIGPIT